MVAGYPEGIYPGREPFAGVEPLEELIRRGQKVFDKIVNTYADKQNVLLVAHGAIFSAMLSAVTNGKIEYGSGKVRFTQGSIYLIRCTDAVIEVNGYEKVSGQFVRMDI